MQLLEGACHKKLNKGTCITTTTTNVQVINVIKNYVVHIFYTTHCTQHILVLESVILSNYYCGHILMQLKLAHMKIGQLFGASLTLY